MLAYQLTDTLVEKRSDQVLTNKGRYHRLM